MRICFILFSIILLLFCSSCVPEENNVADQSFLSQNACSIPCWYGLEAGRSTLVEVKDRLSEIEFVNEATLQEYQRDSTTVFTWQNNPVQRLNRIILVDDLLYSIEVIPNINFTLHDVINFYGNPTAVSGRIERAAQGQVLIKLYTYYEQRGLIIQFRALSSYQVQQIELSNEIEGNSYYLFRPSTEISDFVNQITSLDGQVIRFEDLVFLANVDNGVLVVGADDGFWQIESITALPIEQ